MKTAIGKRITTVRMTTAATRPAVTIMTTDGEKTSAETTNSVEETTIATKIPTGEMTITAVTTTTTGRIFDETTIGTADNQGTPTGITGHKMSARSDGDLLTTIDEDLDLQGPNHRNHRSNKNGN